MVHIYATSGEWTLCSNNGWNFVLDEVKGGRLIALDTTTTINDLKTMILEDYGIEQHDVEIECSFLPEDLINKLGSPPVIISNDRQVKNFVGYVENKATTQLCVTFKPSIDADLNKESSKSSGVGVSTAANNGPEDHMAVDRDAGDESDDGLSSSDEDNKKIVPYSLENAIQISQRFESKKLMKSTMEMVAVKFNFDYKVHKSDTTRWIIRCPKNGCKWRVRAVRVPETKYFIVNKYVGKHTCAPSSKTNVGKTPSAKTVGRLITHRYKGTNEGPKPNEVIQIMLTEHGVELTYSLAWDAREYAISVVRGIPEKSYGKIPKYLYMIKAANPGTHYHYETDSDDRFKYLFLSFGQSVRGFYNVMRRVIIVDGTFLKNKYKGVLLVATALDGNSNLYPIAFGVVDSENDRSWEWFMRQLRVVIADDLGLAFVSDRHGAIVKALEKVYPNATHGICIHHLLGNVGQNFSGKDVLKLVTECSKVYRVPDFEKKFATLCSISPSIGKYLIDADIRKWARQFAGYRYDVRTNNPAESVNNRLRTPREYPVIPLLDSIREMLTRWFQKRRLLSSKHVHPLTIKVEKKIARRIQKGKTFSVYQINEDKFHVIGDVINCIVDLRARECSCGKYNLVKILCRHAIRAALFVGKPLHSLADDRYTTLAWRSAYQECINPVAVPEDAWRVPADVAIVQVLPPETRRAAGRRRKRRYESIEDKIRSSQGSTSSKKRKCSRCHKVGHNKATCDMAI